MRGRRPSSTRRLAAHRVPTAEDLHRAAPDDHRARTLQRILAEPRPGQVRADSDVRDPDALRSGSDRPVPEAARRSYRWWERLRSPGPGSPDAGSSGAGPAFAGRWSPVVAVGAAAAVAVVAAAVLAPDRDVRLDQGAPPPVTGPSVGSAADPPLRTGPVAPDQLSGMPTSVTDQLRHDQGSATPAELADPAGTLQRLAALAAAPPDPPVGGYDYGATRTSDLTSGQPQVTGSERWRADDGSGRTQEFPLDAATGGPVAQDPVGYGPGQLPGPPPLPADPVALRAQLDRTVPGGISSTGIARALIEARLAGPVPAPVQSALLTVLSEQPDVTVTGRVTDHAGRLGLGLRFVEPAAGAPRIHHLVLDPTDGALLAAELLGAVTGPNGGPGLLSYLEFDAVGRVDGPGQRP